MTQGASGRYSNLVDATLTIARTEGLSAFMRGWQPRLIWISMGGFVFFPVLEATKKVRAVAALACAHQEPCACLLHQTCVLILASVFLLPAVLRSQD